MDAPPPNRLAPVKKKQFTGTKGDSLKIVSSKPGVLVVCNYEVETYVVDLELEREIE